MWYEWITSAYLDSCCTGRFRGLREDRVRVVHVHTAGAQWTRLVKDGNHLGGRRGGSSKQIRMVSERGPMHPLGYGLSKGEGREPAQTLVCPRNTGRGPFALPSLLLSDRNKTKMLGPRRVKQQQKCITGKTLMLQHACLLSKNNLVQKHHKSDDQ